MKPHHTPAAVLLAVVALTAAACGASGEDQATTSGSGPVSAAVEETNAGPAAEASAQSPAPPTTTAPAPPAPAPTLTDDEREELIERQQDEPASEPGGADADVPAADQDGA